MLRLATLIAATAILASCTSTTQTSPSAQDRPSGSGTSAQTAAAAFVQGCVGTTTNPGRATEVLKSLGFSETRFARGRQNMTSSFGTASVWPGGQCTVTPKSGSLSQMIPLVSAELAKSGIPVRKLPGEEAWLIGSTGAIALISRSGGAMTRTQPGVARFP
ncbi:MAG: hypothetical protein AAFQ66_02825 [Pseudomonadota bacterium]